MSDGGRPTTCDICVDEPEPCIHCWKRRAENAASELEQAREGFERADREVARLRTIFSRLHLLANFLPGEHAQRVHDEIAEALGPGAVAAGDGGQQHE